jgi:tetratricopeptide (TPR) repeat protein
MKRTAFIRLGTAVLVLGGSAAGAVWWQRAHEQSAKLAAVRPTPPDLSAWPDELRQRIARANANNNVASLAELSRLYHANGFLDEASRCYTALEQLEPREPRWLHRHATILAGRGDAEPALTRWRRVLELAPDYAPARLRLADLLAKSEQPAAAAAAYREILQRAPDDPYATLGLARLDLAAERWQDARAKLESVVAQTNYDLGYDLIVTVYERLNQADAATAVRRRAKASGAFREAPDPWMDELMDVCFDAYRLSLAAGAAQRTGDKAAALRLLERAVALAPNDAVVRFQLAGVLTEAGDLARAREQLVRCTETAPTFADAWAHLSALLVRAGDRAGAERVVATGLQRCPDSPGLYLMRARQLRDAGRTTEAVTAFQTSIRLRPNEADAYLELATTLFRLERVPEGLEQLHAALRAEPEHPAVLSLLAFHAVNQGDETAARAWMQRVRAQPRVPVDQVQRLRAAFREKFGSESP